jgi:hypothetical protein
MSEHETWETQNAAYLSDALEWLRLRLDRIGSPPRAAVAPPAPDAPPAVDRSAAGAKSSWRFLHRTTAADTAAPPAGAPLLLPAGDVNAVDATLDELIARMAQAETATAPPALIMLARAIGLSTFEREVLLLCLAMELDPSVAARCARAQDDFNRTYPTFSLAFALFDNPEWAAVAPDAPLRRFRLLEVTQPGAVPLTASALRVDERILNYAKGVNALDDRLTPLVSLAPPPPFGDPPPSQQRAVNAIEHLILHAPDPQSPPVIRLSGNSAIGRRTVAAVASAGLGFRLYRLSADVLPTHPGELESLARLWQREAMLLPIALLIETPSREKGVPEGGSSPARRFASRAEGLVFLEGVGDADARTDGTVTIQVERPTPEEQRAAWDSLVNDLAPDFPMRLAGQFDLNLTDIQEIAATAQATHETGLADVRTRLWDACLARTRPELDALAEQITPKATWNDLVLPPTEVALLRQAAAQVAGRARVYDEWGFRSKMNRGLGITALFAGESGTGKTMAAEVLANELRLNLYRVDLSAVVSKYIGETEKNLRQVFDAAEAGGAILCFDEADALFGKRSEVKDSHDRYANIEINYLLQRMEAYRGLGILATNMKSALDQAFMRRLRFIVNFPYPGLVERRAIWERVFPDRVPIETLDYDRLARLNLTGGNIHSIALSAAFLAAHASQKVTMALILEAARVEFRKLDRPVNEADLHWAGSAGVAA